MVAVAWISLGAALWLTVAAAVAVVLGRVIRRRDEQVPTADRDGGPAPVPRPVPRHGPRTSSTDGPDAEVGTPPR